MKRPKTEPFWCSSEELSLTPDSAWPFQAVVRNHAPWPSHRKDTSSAPDGGLLPSQQHFVNSENYFTFFLCYISPLKQKKRGDSLGNFCPLKSVLFSNCSPCETLLTLACLWPATRRCSPLAAWWIWPLDHSCWPRHGRLPREQVPSASHHPGSQSWRPWDHYPPSQVVMDGVFSFSFAFSEEQHAAPCSSP